ncbi:UPF0758 family protein [Azospirillum argentinense]|uniref:RadC family protein n=1 Tax=Azospirillum argentinense TaxID=2970906 RepID=UPI0032E03206
MAGRKSAKRSGEAEEAQGLPGLEPPPDVSPPNVSPPDAAVEEAHHKGHRQRLYSRFLDGGPDALQDYELLEMILFAVNPRRDVKPLAKALIRDFGDLWSVVNAPPPRLRGYCVGEVSLASDKAVATLRVVGAAALRGMRQRVMDRPVLANWQSLLDYCTAAMAHQPMEQFRLLFLDRKNKLIADEVQQTGTVDHTPVYPREVVRRALELSASAIILVHNHPSGDPTPSRADVEMTKEILRAAHSLGIAVHDHLIVGKGKLVSFKAQGLL